MRGGPDEAKSEYPSTEEPWKARFAMARSHNPRRAAGEAGASARRGIGSMSRKRMAILAVATAVALTVGIPQQAFAMHIMEGYLPVGYCIAWGAVCIPFLIAGVMRIKDVVAKHRRVLLLLAMVGAFVFVLSALKIPSVSGSSSHPTGTGLGAILFGPSPMAVIGLIVLVFQALLLAHGGLTTLGANTFSMGIVGPFVSFGVYKLARKLGVRTHIAVFLGCCLGSLITYCVTSVQLGLAHPSPTGGVLASTLEFLGVFALTQIPLAVIEGLLSVAVVIGLETYAKPELREIGFLKAKDASDNDAPAAGPGAKAAETAREGGRA